MSANVLRRCAGSLAAALLLVSAASASAPVIEHASQTGAAVVQGPTGAGASVPAALELMLLLHRPDLPLRPHPATQEAKP